FMIPIRDTIPSRNYPVVTTAIIGINVLVYLMQLSQGGGGDRFVYIFGLVPARYSDPRLSHYFTTGQQLFSLFSFMFLHGGFWHLLGNMWSLWIFGDNVEDRLGPLRYLVFYLACGLASGLSHLILNTGSNVPTIGASGAIAGVMGAYFILYPRAKVLTLVPIIFIPLFFEIPAYFFLGFWFLLQFLNATAGHGTAGGIAWWAHIGGFIFGIIFLKLSMMLPDTGASRMISKATEKKHTARLQVIHPAHVDGDDPNLYGTVEVTPLEAQRGTRKMVNIPWGFQKRLIKVIVPTGIEEGGKLRLRGQGRLMPDGRQGDLFLKVVFQPKD
ncbi:MAG: rhomboid family intramembrane serine protease, partial [Thermodesulfobacteriota bacterium]|nr:rhomboid family intramembrane serine protease [Thermodesulfobacteriota bacterium]